jgi:hypothetical protein
MILIKNICWLNNVSIVFLVQVSLLLIDQQGLGHFFRYQPLVPICCRTVQIVQIVCQHWRKVTNTAPATLRAIQEASLSLLSMHNYTPLVISGNDKNKQLTL